MAADFAQLARLALSGRSQDVQLLLQRAVKRYRPQLPDLAEALTALLREAPTRTSPLRGNAEAPMPVDTDTRLQLLRVELRPHLEHEPIFGDELTGRLQVLLRERRSPEALLSMGLEPTKTVLFTGPPGVGKTLAARWLARELGRPLLTLDLAAVMSSYLGRTGGNLRYVLDYAKSTPCVLLLDEVDAIAKRRDDGSEVGELKRLVTVLIQEIDDWPSSGLLVAATNHPRLLDPAIWRRFELLAEFCLPDDRARQDLIARLLNGHAGDCSAWAAALAVAFEHSSYSEIERDLLRTRRACALTERRLEDGLAELLAPPAMTKPARIALAGRLASSGILSQRRISELTGVARDTVRARARKAGGYG
jgi:SpoVK/Ycf46/Vps4 family AAA+-type ATPase